MKNSLLLLLILFSTVLCYSQQAAITGRVVDKNGNPLADVSVQIKGAHRGATTGPDGKFSIQTYGQNPVLIISLVGYNTQEVTYTGEGVVIALEQKYNGLDTVIVAVGYGYQQKKDVLAAVGSVRGNDIKELPATSVDEALQGRIAGVNVIKSSGAPNSLVINSSADPSSPNANGKPVSNADILIRGISSFNNVGPLYIVDGVRSSGENFNMEDIASIDVLKDASASAIYGSAAAGGVILITTKKGTRARPVISFSARYGVTHPVVYQLLNTPVWVKLKQTLDPSYLAGTNISTLPNVNWTDALYSNGSNETYDLSISGGTENASYMVSGFYNGQKGVYIDNSSYLSGARINSDYKLSNAIRVGEQVYVTTQNNNPTNANPAPNPAFRTVPIMPIYDTTNVSGGGWGQTPSGFQGGNAVGQELSNKILSKYSSLQANAFGDATLPLYLNLRVTFSYITSNSMIDNFQEAYNFGAVINSSNNLQKSVYSQNSLQQDYVLTFNHQYGKNSVNALIGYEQIATTNDAISVTYNNQAISPNYSFFPTSNSQVQSGQPTGTYDPNGLVKSEFGRINYNFDNRYYISGVIRRDGNFTKFGPDNRYGIFPSVAGGWRISEEKFFTPVLSVISDLKFRGSYGVLGNDNISSYYFNTYFNASGQGYNFSNGSQIYVGYGNPNLSNPAIKWETLDETNIGLDASFFNNKLTLSTDWYNKITKNDLYNIPLAPSSGIPNKYTVNIGSVQNTGYEFTIAYQSKAGPVDYLVSFNGAFNTNKILSLDGTQIGQFQDGYTDLSGGYGVTGGQNIALNEAGHPFGEFYGYRATGIYQNTQQIANHPQFSGQTANPGDLIFEDVNKSGALSDSDKTFIGNPNPKFVYGANIKLGWKGIDASFIFNGVAGVDLYNGTKAYAQYLFSDGNTTSKVFGDSYLGNNGLTGQPRMGIMNGGSFNFDPNGNYTRVNSYMVEKGGYLKLAVMQIGYNFSSKFLLPAHITNARIFVQGTNVFTITKYTGLNPELYGSVTAHGIDAPNQYPVTRVYSLGVNLAF